MFTSRRHKQQTSTSSCFSAWSMCYCSRIRKLSVWNEAFPMNLFPWRFPHSVTCASLQAKYLNISACVTSVPHVTLLCSDIPPLFMSLSPVFSSLAQFSCPALMAPAHGRKFGSKHLVGHEVHFTCSQGYRLIGPGTRVCQENGTWSGAGVVCKGASKTVKLISIVHCEHHCWTVSGQNRLSCAFYLTFRGGIE